MLEVGEVLSMQSVAQHVRRDRQISLNKMDNASKEQKDGTRCPGKSIVVTSVWSPYTVP